MAIYMFTAKQSEQILEALANAREQSSARRWANLYGGRVFPAGFPERAEESEREDQQSFADEMPGVLHGDLTDVEIQEAAVYMPLLGLAVQLRRAWDDSDPDRKEWWTHELRRAFYLRTYNLENKWWLEPPAFTAFDELLKYFLHNVARARHCQNPACESPYYFSNSRRPQRYCSPKCTGPAKLEAKRRWATKARRKGAR